MKKPRPYLSTLVAAVACLPFAPLSAQEILLQDDFSTYAIGSLPTNPGDGNPNDWALHGYEVQETDNPDSVPVGVVAVEETNDWTGNFAPSLHIMQKAGFSNQRRDIGFRRDFESVSTERLTVSFRVQLTRAMSAGTADTQYAISLTTGNDIGPRLLIINGPANRDRQDSTNPKPGFTVQFGPNNADRTNIIPEVLIGDWYEVKISTIPAEQTYDVSVKNLNSTDAAQSNTLTDVGYRTEVSSLNRIVASRNWTWLVIDAMFDDFLITKGEPGGVSSIDAWKTEHFSSVDHADAGDELDPDGDGVSNLLEYVLGGEPLAASRNLLPASDYSDDQVRLTFARSAADDVGLAVESSVDLLSWTPVAERASGSAEWQGIASVFEGTADERGMVSVEVTSPTVGANRVFLRLRVLR